MLHFILYGIVLAAAIYYLTEGLGWWFERHKLDGKIHSWLLFNDKTTTIWVFVVLWLTTPFYYEFSGFPFSTPVSFSVDGKVRKHAWGMFTVGLGGNYSNLSHDTENLLISAPSVTLVTDNPKVRNFSHNLSLTIVDLDLFYNSDPRRKRIHSGDSGGNMASNDSIKGHLYHICTSELYNFNNARSRELAQFFNPLDTSQQERYRDLIEEFVGPFVASNGLAFARARFDIK